MKVVNWDKVSKEEKVTLDREIELHKNLDHPNIVKLFSHEKKDGKLYIVLEYLPKGTLFDKIQKERLNNEQITDIFIGLMDAVAYIHDKNMVHRDIKPENVISAEDGTFKLCDFGFSAFVGEVKGKYHRRKTFCGT